MSSQTPLKWIAAFEAIKGLAALASALGWLGLLHHDIRHLALELIGHFDLDPTSHYPALLLHYVELVNAIPVGTILLVAIAYALTRWVEACGLWANRAWGEWLGALSGAIYVPFEVRHIVHGAGWQSVAVLLFNVVVVAYLALRLWGRRGPATP